MTPVDLSNSLSLSLFPPRRGTKVGPTAHPLLHRPEERRRHALRRRRLLHRQRVALHPPRRRQGAAPGPRGPGTPAAEDRSDRRPPYERRLLLQKRHRAHCGQRGDGELPALSGRVSGVGRQWHDVEVRMRWWKGCLRSKWSKSGGSFAFSNVII